MSNHMNAEIKARIESDRETNGQFGERKHKAPDLTLTAPATTFEEMKDFHSRSAKLARLATKNERLSTVALAARGVLIDFPGASRAVLSYEPLDNYLVRVDVYSGSGTTLGCYDVESMDRSGLSTALTWLDMLEEDSKYAAWKQFTVPNDQRTIDLAAAAAWAPEEDPSA